ncbi:lipid-A-disaccharide synthase N-terminal domain-containing protein [Hyphomicrobium sp.]|uniref:lipid-A-disaccharide synthase N-terminal domain-containing protein n=1 Tax=Hyphomicrobium sp. TaxID=82 RepID=UPI0025C672D9|nr:lipid-A-disaccharide synthase N-terminal domain-containing protein [Hyphomicrobium sp.]MCC7254240.1 lipid-A-disaccharide synthase N-terminal domain-containing protein [Hyphomicrobium sp.]
MLAKLTAWWAALSPAEVLWLSVGLTGQALFSARWLVQWLVTEKSRRSTMPDTFWYLSLLGGLLVLAYGLHRLDPVIILGQFGVMIYARNLFFIRREKQASAPDAEAGASVGRSA